MDMRDAMARAGQLPDESRRIREERGAPKERVTPRIDRDVLRFVRPMGDGYGLRMNEVPRALVLARLACPLRDVERAWALMREVAAGDGERPGLAPEELAEMKRLAERIVRKVV